MARASLRARADVEPAELVDAARRPVEAPEDVHQRALAGAARPDDRDELALLDLEVDLAERAHRSRAGLVVLLDATERDERGFDHGAQNIFPFFFLSASSISSVTIFVPAGSPPVISVVRPSVMPIWTTRGSVFSSPSFSLVTT